MAVIAAMTAQNTLGVSSVAEVAPEFVAEQLDAVLIDLTPDCTKTGMLLTAPVIDVVAQPDGTTSEEGSRGSVWQQPRRGSTAPPGDDLTRSAQDSR